MNKKKFPKNIFVFGTTCKTCLLLFFLTARFPRALPKLSATPSQLQTKKKKSPNLHRKSNSPIIDTELTAVVVVEVVE
jgi:hypothetical protein